MNIVYWGIEYLANWIEVYLTCTVTMKGFQIEKKSQQNMGILISSFMALFILLCNSLKMISVVQSVLFVVIDIVLLQLYIRKQILKVVGYVCSVAAMIVMADGMSIFCIIYSFGGKASSVIEQPSFIRVISLILSKALLVFLVSIFERIHTESSHVKKSYLYIADCMEIMLLIGVFSIVRRSIDQDISVEVFIILVVAIVAFLSMHLYLDKMFQLQQQNLQLQLLALRNEMLEQSLKNTEASFQLWRKAVHDYKHHVIAIRQLVNEQKLEQLKDYLEEAEKLINSDMFYQKTGHDTVDTLLNLKKQQAIKRGITFVINTHLTEDISHAISDIHIASLLGNIVDNAINGAVNEENPWIQVNMETKKEVLLIKVENAYTGKKIDFKSSDKEKRQFRGIGISSTKDIVKEYGGTFQIKQLEEKVRCMVSIPINRLCRKNDRL